MLAIYGQAQGRPSASQSPPGMHPAPPLPADPDAETNASEAQRHAMLEMQKKANVERQAALKNDTEKLLKLAEELKTSVDKSSASVLSLDVVKKAEEIEKLAKSVKEKMRGPN
jgi:nitric oxide reductase activation protein